MSRIDELIELLKFNKGEVMKKEKRCNVIACVLGVLAVLAIIAGIVMFALGFYGALRLGKEQVDIV